MASEHTVKRAKTVDNEIIPLQKDEDIMLLLGRNRIGSIYVTRDQVRSLHTLYGLETREAESFEEEFIAVGKKKGVVREATIDGLRMMAVMAPLLEKGEDPVEVLVAALGALGYDTGGMH